MTVANDQLDLLATYLENELMDKYGPILTGDALRRALGYSSTAALRQAVARGKAPVPLFRIKDRRGQFALVKDVACWLAEQRSQACK